jgi:hypothetical protein
MEAEWFGHHFHGTSNLWGAVISTRAAQTTGFWSMEMDTGDSEDKGRSKVQLLGPVFVRAF